MKEFFSNKSIKVLAITLSVVLFFSVLGNFKLNFISSLVNSVTGGLSKVSASVTSSVKKKSYDELEKENKQLQKENSDLKTQLVDYYDIKEENARLWQYYGIQKENDDYEILPSKVIGRDANNDFYSFTADVGTKDGVKVLDPVITEKGLVGFVSYVNSVSCKVTTILSPNAQVSAVDKITGDSGIVTGNALYSDKNQTTLTTIDSTSKVETGNIITTSGLGGIYPDNLIIGEVKEVKYNDYDASKYAVIDIYEDIKTVTDVVVITNFDGKGKISADSSEGEN